MASEPPPANRRRASTRGKEKEKETEREREEYAEKPKEKYESRTHILEDKMQEWDGLLER
jgi:hypothetical protein